MAKTKKAKVKKPEMNRDDRQKLIRLVQNRPVLYIEETNLKDRNEAWTEILEAFDKKFTVDLLKSKWRSLRGDYIKYVKGQEQVKNFWARDLMAFLGTAENFGTSVKTQAAVPLEIQVKQSSDGENEDEQEEEELIEEVDKDSLIRTAKASMSSKLIGDDVEFLAELCVEATQFVKVTDAKHNVTCPISAVNILKFESRGKSARGTYLICGYALNCTRASDAMPRRVDRAKIACLDSTIDSVLAGKFLENGVNVILTTGNIDGSCLKQFTEGGAMVICNLPYIDLVKVSSLTDATLISIPESDEQFDVSFLGAAEKVVQECISDNELVLIKTTKPSASVILSGANDAILDEMERSLRDAFFTVKRVLESKKLVKEKKLSNKWWADEKLQPAGTYTIVDKKLRLKLLNDNKNDLMSLTKCVFGFGIVFLTSYGERWLDYKRQANSDRKTAFLGSERFAMIKLRQWTPNEQLPDYAVNNGHAAYGDEHALHSLPLDFNKDFATSPGTNSPAISFLNLNSEALAEDKTLQNEMTKVLMNALLNPEFVEDKVPCPMCDETFGSTSAFRSHLERHCQFIKDPYGEYRSINWEEFAKPIRENRSKRKLLSPKEDESEPPSKRSDVDP